MSLGRHIGTGNYRVYNYIDRGMHRSVYRHIHENYRHRRLDKLRGHHAFSCEAYTLHDRAGTFASIYIYTVYTSYNLMRHA